MEKLINVSECHDKYFAGYHILTSENSYKIIIDDNGKCCEDYGYISSNDDFEEFYGKDILSIDLTNTECDSFVIPKFFKEFKEYQEGFDNIQFITLRFEDGILQFAVYNYHNGYYGHDIMIIKNGVTILESII